MGDVRLIAAWKPGKFSQNLAGIRSSNIKKKLITSNPTKFNVKSLV
jgi:hypothetical protein